MQPQTRLDPLVIEPSPICVLAPAEKKLPRFAIDFLIGGVSAAVSKTVAAPMERAVFLSQNRYEMLRADYFKKLFNFKKDRDGYWVWFAGNLASGGAAGASSLFFVYPLDYARARLENDAKKGGGGKQFNGLIDVYKKTLAADGIAGLYRGFNISCVRIIVFSGLYFGLYDSLRPNLRNYQDTYCVSFALGCVVTLGASLVSHPIDTVRRRMMMTTGQVVKYKSSMDALKQMLRNEGPSSLFKGRGANILRVYLGAGVLACYDKLQMIIFGKTYGSDIR
ncbi:hypothetical protein L1987_39405 [Smallanthus sonchifolius]|uniref:Uncharacterized protein n=1 Tax=Smallanthus sonchifolius TaxID=185202 RepID=A0ACB9HN46_9ASTR|nr:hypothetical protein L1987_39405 [Smallanthus sonchifolius]